MADKITTATMTAGASAGAVAYDRLGVDNFVNTVADTVFEGDKSMARLFSGVAMLVVAGALFVYYGDSDLVVQFVVPLLVVLAVITAIQ